MSFEVDLENLLTAIGTVKAEQSGMEDDIAAMKGYFDKVEDAWKSPSGADFTPLRQSFDQVSGDAVALLKEAVGRMQVSYDNYHDTETTNRNNLTQG